MVRCCTEMLGLQNMVGAFDSDLKYKTQCDYDEYSPKWYALQLAAYLEEGGQTI